MPASPVISPGGRRPGEFVAPYFLRVVVVIVARPQQGGGIMFLIPWPSPARRPSPQPQRPPGQGGGRGRRRPRLEALEDRLLLATFLVTSADDAGTGSLRQAILDANAAPAGGVIAFQIGAGVRSITPAAPLPAVTRPVVIDG